MITKITNDNFLRIINGEINKNLTFVIKFYTNSCPKCKELSPSYKNVASDYETDEFLFCIYNSADADDKCRDRYKNIGVQGVPSLLMVKTGTKPPKMLLLGAKKKPHPRSYYNIVDIESFVQNGPKHMSQMKMEKK
jgi:thiol-disulfide isomerase/thioredoxin